MPRKYRRYELLKEVNAIVRRRGEPDPFTRFYTHEEDYRYAA